jgi:hypothetical protein
MKAEHVRRVLGWVAVVTLLQGCEGPKSSSTSGPQGGPVPTSRMTLYLTVESDDLTTSVVRANLNDGDALGTSYRLDGGDYFRACVNGVCRNMADNDSVFTPDYIARFAYQPGVDFVVSFNRREARSAPSSRVTMPAAFTIVTPADRQQVTDGDTVTLSWTPTGAPARVYVDYEAECTFSSGPASSSVGRLGSDANGDGSELVRIDPIVNFARSNVLSPVTGCRIDLLVSHELQGHVDPAFDGGTAMGIVTREVRLNYIPR